jgi:noranthrone synthase
MVLRQAAEKATNANRGMPTAKAQAAERPVPTQNAQARAPAQRAADLAPSTLTSAPAAAKPVKPVGKQHKAQSGTIKAVLTVIAEESGVALEELTDDTNFTDMGIDSLGSMAIGSRLREDLTLDLKADFSLFIDCPTVGCLKAYLGSAPAPEEAGEEEQFVDEEVVEKPPTLPPHIIQSTPSTENDMKAESEADSPLSLGDDVFNAALRVVSEESGVALEELTADTVFADIGIDSLSSMVIGSRFREDLGIPLDSSFNLFEAVPTVTRLQQLLGGRNGSSTPSITISGDEETCSSQPSSVLESDTTMAPTPRSRVSACRPTSSVILQGLPRMAKQTLFMLPDGGGSASSYMTIPRLQSDVAVVGLNCPYARDPECMDCTHQAMIESFCNEIKRRQPHGPYHLGGWSSGGAFAYVTAEALTNMNEEVHSLVIVDAPVPQVMEKLPASFYEHCNNIGLFANQPGGANDSIAQPPPYLIPHFQATVDVMLDYRVAPLKTTRMPKVGIIWAADTVMDEANAPKMKGMHFMVQKRTDFGPDGWDTVLPGAAFDIVRADGANHFTLMVSLID